MAQTPYDVAEAFKNGRRMTRGAFVATPDALYTYGVRLAHRNDAGEIVIDVDWESTRKISATTARHVAAARHVLG